MLMKNLTDKSVSKRLPNREWVTLEPEDEYDFPNMVGYTGDERLTKVNKVAENELKPAIKRKMKEVIGDLLDDGKLNYSNNPKKNSPGRKKKK